MRPLAERLRYAENYCVLAKHQLENGKQEQALLSLRQALQLVPRHVAALASMVRLCYSRGELEQAQSYLQRWLAADGRDSECHFLYGNLCLGLQQYEQGLEHYQQARELGDDSPDLCFNQGLAHYLLGDLSGAERLFRQTLEADPGFARALDGLGCVARSRGRPEAATALFRQAVAADPTFLETLDHLVQVLIDLLVGLGDFLAKLAGAAGELFGVEILLDVLGHLSADGFTGFGHDLGLDRLLGRRRWHPAGGFCWRLGAGRLRRLHAPPLGGATQKIVDLVGHVGGDGPRGRGRLRRRATPRRLPLPHRRQ